MEVVVVKEGRGGILGLGAEDAIIRVTPIRPVAPKTATPEKVGESGAEQAAREVLERLLSLMGLSGNVESQSLTDARENETITSSVSLDVRGDDLGILIGRRGQTLAALQYVVRLMVGRRIDKWVPVIIDVEGYRQRRSEALKRFAIEMADRVKARGAPFTLEPMPPHERRIIHMALADNPHVFTESTGQGEERKVVIRPKK